MKKLLVVLLVLGMAVPAMASEWNFFGSARMATFYLSQDTGDLDDAGILYDDADLSHTLQANSRLGATVKASDMIGGVVEIGIGTGGLSTRKIYGTYNFGGGELLIGQTYTPTTYFYSNSVYGSDGDLCGLGQFNNPRSPMVQLSVNGFKVALVSPIIGTASLGTYTDADVSLPKIEASYSMKNDAFFLDVFGGYQTYDLEDNANDQSKTVSSFAVGFDGGMTFGPATITVAANTGTNYGAYGAAVGWDHRDATIGGYALTWDGFAGPQLVDDNVEDTTALQAMIVANFILADNFSMEAGFGYSSLSNSEAADAAGFDEDTLTQMQYYINGVYTFAPGFFIVPEIGIIDYGDWLDGDTSLGSDTYIGLKWQIDF